MRYLEPQQLRAFRPSGAAHLAIEIEGDRCILAARIKRAFPLSQPVRYVSIQDAEGKEVGLLTTMEGLEPTTRALFEAQLDRTYFTPRISEIRYLKLEAGMWRFRVATQRGPAEFFVRNWRDSATEIAPDRWHIMSVDGGRYEIENIEGLDASSRRLLDQVL